MKKLLTCFVGLIVVFAMASVQAFADNIKFVQVSDTHLSSGSEYSKKVLKSAVADINKQADISFVVFTGDNINNPKEDNLREFVKIVSKLKAPYYVVLGNHDVYKSDGLSKVRYYEILRERNILYPQRKPNYAFKKDDFTFLIVDGAKEVIPGSAGYYRKGTLAWLEDQLEKNEKKNVVIFQHFPVEYPEGMEHRVKSHKTYKVEQYQEVLSKHHNVLAIISGHFHVNSEHMNDGVYHIASPSLQALPHAYKIIDIITTKEFSPIIYTQLREFEVKE